MRILKSLALIPTLIVLALTVGSLIAFNLKSPNALADGSFNPGRIIDDAVFTNKSAMSVSSIQTFLNSKVSICDTQGTRPSEYGGGTRAQWAANQALHPNIPAFSPPFTCLKDYSENGRSSAQIIYDVAQEYNINPQVLIVLLQKEQALVTDTWPSPTQYQKATGYGCPDNTNGQCDTQYYGFTNQVSNAARMFNAIVTNNPNWYTPYLLGTNYILYSPDRNCGGSNVTIQNRATQALYNYTPYQPNQAAINANMGVAVNCGAYGNLNFYRYFTSWFGSTSSIGYSWTLNSWSIYSDAQRTAPLSTNRAITATPGQTLYVTVSARNTGTNNWSQAAPLIGTFNASVYKNESWLSSDRAARSQESSVKYDQNATYNFSITAPSQVGSYSQQFNLVVDGVTWLNSAGPVISINVAQPVSEPSNSAISHLESNTSLLSTRDLFSADRNSILKLEDGNLNLYINFIKVWSTNIANSGAVEFRNQDDGNLVLYNKNGGPVWATNTSGNGASTLILQNDGNLVLYSGNGPKWSSNTSRTGQVNYINNSLESNEVLFTNQSLMTPDRNTYLTLQSDGNLVLYTSGRAIWASNTVNSGSYRLVSQGDGNIVMYNRSGQATWASRTAGRGSSYLLVQMDRNLVTYSKDGPTWATNTSGR